MANYDLSDQNISDTFQNLLQKTGSAGTLYDGLGQKVTSLAIDGTLYAQSYVVTQSVNVVNFSSGSNIFGNTVDDVHIFTGSISSSALTNVFRSDTVGYYPMIELKNDNTTLSLPNITFTSGSEKVGISGMLDDAGGYGGRLPSLVFYSSSAIPTTHRAVIMDFTSDSASLGINTLVPSKELTVKGDISASGDIFTGDSLKYSGTTTTYISFFETGTSIRFRDAGTAVADFDNALVHFNVFNTNTDFRIDGDTNDNVFFLDAGTEKVGIGTATPDKTLTVAGDISASGIVYAEHFHSSDDAHITDDLTVMGDINANGNIVGDDSTDITNINEIYLDSVRGDAANDVKIELGGNGITFFAEAGDKFSFNEGESNVDLRYYNSDEATMVYFDADTSKVGIGEDISETPAKTLTVKGDISASGHLYLEKEKFIYFDSPSTDFAFRTYQQGIGGPYVLMNKVGGVGGVLVMSGSNQLSYVGIGTGVNNTPPVQGLSVAGDISASGQFFSLSGSGHSSVETLSVGQPVAATNMELTVGGDISASGDLQVLGGITASKNVVLPLGNAADDSYGRIKFGTPVLGYSTISSPAHLTVDIITSANRFRQMSTMTNVSGKLLVGDLSTTAPNNDGVTVYGDITASGDLYVRSGSFNTINDSGKTLTVAGDISASGDIHIQTDEKIYLETNVTDNNHIHSDGTHTFVKAAGFGIGNITNAPKTLTVGGDISASGAIYASSYDGYHGNDEFIAILPGDFTISDNAGRGHAGYTDNNGGRVLPVGGDDLFAMKIIPKGFTAVSGSLFGSDVTNPVLWHSSSMAVGTIATVSTDVIESATGTGSAFTNAVVGDGGTFVICEWNPGSSDRCFGGKIYIERT